jgi:hypothetical protein
VACSCTPIHHSLPVPFPWRRVLPPFTYHPVSVLCVGTFAVYQFTPIHFQLQGPPQQPLLCKTSPTFCKYNLIATHLDLGMYLSLPVLLLLWPENPVRSMGSCGNPYYTQHTVRVQGVMYVGSPLAKVGSYKTTSEGFSGGPGGWSRSSPRTGQLYNSSLFCLLLLPFLFPGLFTSAP